jgi:gliding motility-associated-like protein
MRAFSTLLFLLLGLIVHQQAFAQPAPPNCPPAYAAGYSIVGDSVSFCLDGVNLQVIPTSTLKSTDSYSVDPIPYNPYPWVGANQLFVGQDDIWSAVIPLPFPFCFFGQKYNSVVIGANGQVGFDLTQAGMYNAWASNGIVAPNSNAAMNNTIMAPYHDVDPSIPYAGKNITWDIYGTAPCRYMVISWDSVPMFSCNNLLASQQIVLFESTYLIDINIKSKPVCGGWNGGVAHQGIQNAAGTVAFMVPGRNGTVWNATNDSYRFTPAGLGGNTLSYIWKELPSGTVLGTGPTLNYFPAGNAQVTVDMQVTTNCDTIQAANRDTINVVVTGSVDAGFTYEVRLGCNGDTVIFTNTSVSQAGGTPLYIWNFDDGTGSSVFSPTHVYSYQDTFRVRLIAVDNGCNDTMEALIDLRHPINAVFATNNDSICLGVPTVVSSNSSPLGFVTHHWDFGNGDTLNTGTTVTGSYTYGAAGTYVITLTITDTLGCTDTATQTVYVDQPGFADFTMSDNDLCVGDPVFFYDTLSPNSIGWRWNFGDGKVLSNVHNPVHTWADPGTYNVTLTAFYPICDSIQIAKNLVVNAYPSVNLGPDTAICPGLTGSILLTNLNNQGSIFQWSTGATASAITVTEGGRYWLTASNGECSTTDSIWIKRDCYLNIPNAFSPDGDGLNDWFLPRELLSSGLRAFKMNIYNRWGENIFTTDAIDGRGWDGKYNGKLQPMGVYVYVIEAEFINGVRKNYQGNVTLVR